jgi:hypothetical protein
MDGASGGPRSATELAAAARGLKELLDTSLLPQDVYDARLAALKAEAAELVAAPRARSSIGDAASPAPTGSQGSQRYTPPPALDLARAATARAATARAAQRPRVHRTHQRSAATCLRALAAPALRNPAQRSQLLIFRGPPPLRRGLNFLKFAPALRAGRWLTS